MLRRVILCLCASGAEVILSIFGSDPILPYSRASKCVILTGYTFFQIIPRQQEEASEYACAAFHPLTQVFNTSSRCEKQMHAPLLV